MNNVGAFFGGLVSIAVVLLISALVAGFFVGIVLNIVGLANCDFEAPYRAEIIRVAGLFSPPLGAVVGWVDLGR